MIDLASSYPNSTAPHPTAAAAEARELLAQFAATGKQAHFEEIVRRYGGMVFNTAFEITRNRHDAEDATQAAFLSLAVQAKSGKEVIAIGPWLQQVSRRLALDINRSRKRRRNREDRFSQMWEERQTDTRADSPAIGGRSGTGPEYDELRAVIQEELAQVPPKYRMPLILHYFGGLSREEMAKELNCRANTLGVRLHRGREMLGKRLAKRGVALSGIMIGIVMAEVIRDVVRESLIRSTAHAASLLNAGHPYACGTVAPEIIGMARTAGSAMLMAKVKVGTILALIAGTAAAASAQMVQRVAEWTSEGTLNRLFKDWFKSPELPTDLSPRPPVSPQVKSDEPTLVFPPGANPPPMQRPFVHTLSNPWLPQLGTVTTTTTKTQSALAPSIAPLATFNRAEDLSLSTPPPRQIIQRPIVTSSEFRNSRGSGGGGETGRGGRNNNGSARGPLWNLPLAVDFDFQGPKAPHRDDPASKVRQLPDGTIVAPLPPVPQHIYNPNPVVPIPESPAVPATVTPRDVWISPPPVIPDNTMQGGYMSSGVRYVSSDYNPAGPESFDTIIAQAQDRSLMKIGLGEVSNGELVVGYIGTGVAIQSAGEHTLDSLYLGVVASGRGLYDLQAGNLKVRRTPLEAGATAHIVHIGAGGEGLLKIGNEFASGNTYETGEGRGVDLVIGGTPESRGTIQGWGRIALSGVLTNGGQVIADGYDQPRTLDLSSVSSVKSNGATNAGHGWYATRQGKAALPTIAVMAGTHTYTWGDVDDAPLSLVNSARLTLTDVEREGKLNIALMALDRPDLPPLPQGHQFIGAWNIDAGGLVAAGGMDLTIRYDEALAARLGLDESVLKIWTCDQGEWIRRDFDPTFVRDPVGHTLGVHTELGTISYFAVSAPEPGISGMMAAGIGLYLCQRRRRRR